jgi:thiol-disulfide isomerase/thioredoxin
VTKLSTWAVVAFFLGFATFSAKVKSDLARAKAFDAFQGGLSHGADAPAFELVTLDGLPVRLDQQVEQSDLVLVNFWATWCPPCRLEMPLLERLHETHGEDGLRIVAIDVGEDSATVEAFLEKKPVSFPVLLDTDGAVSARYRVNAFPTSFLLDTDGKLIDVVEGLDPYLTYRIEAHLDDFSSDSEAESEKR